MDAAFLHTTRLGRAERSAEQEHVTGLMALS